MSEVVDKPGRLLKLIELAVVDVDAEIQKGICGASAIDGLKQLQFIKATLQGMISILNSNNWRSIPRPKPGIARLVVDSWPLDNPLSERICEIEQMYSRLK